MIKKIVTIGPESTGKSFLCTQLAAHYKSAWCPEFAREYLLKNGMNYTYDDLLTIAKGQLKLEEKIMDDLKTKIASNKAHDLIHHTPYLIDTDMNVMKVWCSKISKIIIKVIGWRTRSTEKESFNILIQLCMKV